MQKVCEQCSTPFEAQSGRARFCGSSCRGKSHRGDAPANVVALHGDTGGKSGVVAATTAELEAAGRLNTSAGQDALLLAQLIATADHRTAPALIKQHHATMEKALDGVAGAGDALDELRLRRERKIAGG